MTTVPAMKIGAVSAFLAALPGAAAPGRAQPPFTVEQSAPAELIPYSEPLPVPPNACVWANWIYSDGAVIVARIPFTTYFRCEQGAWKTTAPGTALAEPRAPHRPGGSPPARPTAPGEGGHPP